METDGAIKLVKELKQNKLLPQYNEEQVNEVAKQICGQYVYLTEDFAKLKDENQEEDSDADDVDAAFTIAANEAMQRNVRCVQAYM